MFTQRHFEAVAAVFRKQLEDIDSAGQETMIGALHTTRSSIIRIAAMFSIHQPRFNQEKFFLACGLNANGSVREN